MNKLLIGFINIYQKFISPILKGRGINCKYYPTCSEYTKQALQKYGFFKGIHLGIKRFIRCNPFSKGGYEPLE